MKSNTPSNHKKRWTEAEQKKLRDFANNAQQKDQSPFDFCHAIATDFNERKPDAIFLQLSTQGLLNKNIAWHPGFQKDWQDGKYQTISWANNAKQEIPQKMLVNQDNSSSSSENGSSSSLKLESFQYSKSEEQELSRFFHKALDNEQSAPWCGVENGPTGLGKTHYMTKEMIAAIEKLIQQENLPRLTILLIAPQHRHLDKIRDDIEKHLTKNNLNQCQVALIKASSVIDMAKSQYDYLPATCPHINDNSAHSKQAKQILESMESLASNDNGNSQTGKTLSEQRNQLRQRCKIFIEQQVEANNTEPGECQQCQFMHIGKAIFEATKARVTIIFSTYDKLFYGYNTYRLNHKQKYVHEFYSPWVSLKTGHLKPIKKTVFLLEESTAGFNTLWNKIHDASLHINLTEYVTYLYHNFKPQVYKTLAGLEYDKKAQAHDVIQQQQQKIQDTLAQIEKLYIRVSNGKIPIFGDNQLIQFKGETDKSIERILQSTETFFSDLFPNRIIAYQASQQVTLATIIASLQLFDGYKLFKASQMYSVFPLANYYMALGINPVVSFFKGFRIATQKIDNELNYFELALNHFLVDGNETSRDKLEYFRHKLNERKLGETPDNNTDFTDALDHFYLTGFEYMAMPYIREKDEYYIAIESCQDTPEGMLVSLLNDSLKNKVLLVSASASIESPLTTHNLQWLEKRANLPIEYRQQDSLKKVIAHKYTKRGKPNIYSYPPIYQREDNHEFTILTPQIDETIKAFIKERFIQHDKWFSEIKGEHPFHVVLSFLESLLQNRGIPRYALFLGNSGVHADIAIELIQEFFAWADKRGIELEVDLEEPQKVIAKDFKNFSHEEENNLDQKIIEKVSNKVDNQKRKIIDHLLSTEKPKVFVIASAYNSISIGANLQLPIPKAKLEDAITDGKVKNLELYMRDKKELRYFEGENPTIDIDMSDIMLSVAKTYVIDETNYISASHILVATNDASFRLLAKGVLDPKDKEIWMNVSSVVQKTQAYHLAQLDIAMQALGRMDRSFNIPATANIYLSEKLVKSLQQVESDRVQELIYTKTFEQVMNYAQKGLRRKIKPETRHKDKVGNYMTKLVNAGFDKENPKQAAIQNLWHKLREFFAHHQVLSNTVMLATLDGEHSNKIAAQIIDIMAMLEEFKGSEIFWDFKGFFYQLPVSVVTDIKKADRVKTIKYPIYVKRIVELYFSVDEERGKYYYASRTFDKNARRQEYISNDTSLNADKEKLIKKEPIWVLKPDMMRDVAIPAYDEEETKRYLKMQGYGVEERLPAELFEVADIYVPNHKLLIDNKSYSSQTFKNLEGKKLADMLDKAREKLLKVQDFYGQKNFRLVYVTRNWWGNLYDRMPSFCVHRGKNTITTDNKDDFDVAFLTTNRNQDFSHLEQLLKRIKKLDSLSN